MVQAKIVQFRHAHYDCVCLILWLYPGKYDRTFNNCRVDNTYLAGLMIPGENAMFAGK
jgi:hypothetical protein